ncbi:aldehyde dehydrogenase (NADP(+)) [Cryobacterium melibiosiphilum]|uniref:Aldehyde dehydrogenase (NADP(+)) n=1 Tax=Cryobacterium melibiosiphilum TaxID=995039 RepID=A0A3A5ML38_9MICO|nr:aldehyde dehydrogenase (NADP(+)) [Cryobacterium melibiosiphilum]RJT85177.1 aldehyde dehydrogenase (NADP(+)) [Cryobacterium melibiosiphilum]
MTVQTATVSTSTDLTGFSLIGGVPVTGTHGEVAGVNPVTGETLAPGYGLVGVDEVDRAAELAWTAFATYRKTAPEARAAFLETIADNIAGLGQALTDRVIAETGLPLPRVLGETGRTVGQLRLFAAVLREGNHHGARIDPAQTDRAPLPRPDIRLTSIALGPVAVFGASNFPLAFSVAGGDTASALAAGCPVIVKAHSAHPGTSELIGRAISDAVATHDLPAGVFSLLFGGGASVGAALVSHPRIKAVGFTGSRSGGLALVAAAAARPEPIPVYAEMSSINPVFVLPGALAQGAAALGEQWVASVATGTGQLCTSPGLVFLPQGPDGEAFTAAAAAAIEKLVATPMLTGGIRDAFDRGAAVFRDHAGVENVAVARANPDVAIGAAPQLYATDAATFVADPALQEEVFGPASLVVTVRDTAEMARILAGLEGQLTVTLHTDGAENGAAELLDEAELRAGRVLFNGWPTGVEVVSAMVHGGPFPATSNAQGTSVGTLAIDRFLRPVSYQNVPAALLPAALRDDNPLGIFRQHDGQLARD